MRDHLISLIGGLGSLVLIYTLLGNPGEQPRPISKPHSDDRGEYGLQGLRLWLDENQIKTYSLRRPYQSLFDHSEMPAKGNLLITTLPHSKNIDYEDNYDLYHWLEEGNSLILLAAENDFPQWSQGMRFSDSDTDLLDDLGFQFQCNKDKEETDEQESGEEKGKIEKQEEDSQPSAPSTIGEYLDKIQKNIDALGRATITLEPTGNNPVLTGVKNIQSHITPALAASACELVGNYQQVTQPILTYSQKQVGDEPTNGEIGSKNVMWQIHIGSGRVWGSGFSDLFSNENLAEMDNNRLLLNLLNYSLQADGWVIFDDYRQGLSELYDPDTFFSDERLHYTLLFIAIFWLVYLLGYVNRLAKPRQPIFEVNTSHYIKATAGFFARRVSERTIAEGMIKHFFAELGQRHRKKQSYPKISSGQPDWHLLENYSNISTADLGHLKEFMEQIEAGRKPDLLKLQHLLNRLRKAQKI